MLETRDLRNNLHVMKEKRVAKGPSSYWSWNDHDCIIVIASTLVNIANIFIAKAIGLYKSKLFLVYILYAHYLGNGWFLARSVISSK